MKTIVIYTNGKSLFTLNNYSAASGTCYANNIIVYKKADYRTARVMHAKGQLHYISGVGDTKYLKDKKLKRNQKIQNFIIN